MGTVDTPSIDLILRKVKEAGGSTSHLTAKEWAVYSGYTKAQGLPSNPPSGPSLPQTKLFSFGGTTNGKGSEDPYSTNGLTAPGAGSSNAAEHDSPNGGAQAGSSNAAEHDYQMNHPQDPGEGAAPTWGKFGANNADPNAPATGVGSTWGAPTPAAGAGPNYQQLPGFNAPAAPNVDIHRNDFSQLANQLVGDAYKPRYDALNTGRADAKQQYNTSDAVVKGLYANLANTNASNAKADATRYDQAGAAQKASGAQLQNDIGNTYNSTAASEAALWKSLGITPGTDTSQLLKTVSADQNNAKANAAVQSAAENASIGQQKQTQLDYQTNSAKADQTNGTANREALVSQLGHVMSGYDQNQQDLAGQQASQAIDQGNQLSTQDLSAQQANAQSQQSSYSAALQAAQAEYNAKAANVQFQNTQMNQNHTLAAQQAAAQFAAMQAQQDQENKNRQFQLDQTNSSAQNSLGTSRLQVDAATSLEAAQEKQREFNASNATAQGKIGTTADPSYANMSPMEKAGIDITGALGGDAGKSGQALQILNDAYTKGAASKADFNAKTQAALIQAGLNPLQAATVASSYWARINPGAGGVGTVPQIAGTVPQTTGQ